MKLYAADYLVIMVPTTSMLDFGRIEPTLDSAAAFLAERIAPRYDRILSSVRMRTSEQVPQFVVVLMADEYADFTAGGASGQWIEISYGNRMAAEAWIEILAHELAHAWDLKAWLDEGFSKGFVHSQTWYKEGLAAYLATDAVREWQHVGFADNLPLRWHLDPGGRYYHAAWNADGRYFGYGYQMAAAFLRDATWTLMREAGYTHDQAGDAVISAARRGWYGCTEVHCTMVGLADQMALKLGHAWDPADALVDWALSEAVDDVVQSSRYKIPSFTGTSFLLNPQPVVPFPPVLTINAGNGITATVNMPQYATGFVDVHVGAAGATLSVSNSSVVRWKLMRID